MDLKEINELIGRRRAELEAEDAALVEEAVADDPALAKAYESLSEILKGVDDSDMPFADFRL